MKAGSLRREMYSLKILNLEKACVDRVLFSLEKQEAKFWSRQSFLWHCNEHFLNLTFL